MVVIVAAVLAFLAVQLQPIQQQNIDKEKKQNILSAVAIESDANTAEELFAKYVSMSYVVNSKGEKIDGIAFDINMALENKLPAEQRQLPVFECDKDGAKFYIVPVRGKGLWGPIWGYLAFESDMNTIYGASFDHKGETPGLGADINKDWFEQPFKGKTIFEGDKLVSVTVYKGGRDGAKDKTAYDKHGVDAISGGTITSKSLEKMLIDCLQPYETYFKNTKK